MKNNKILLTITCVLVVILLMGSAGSLFSNFRNTVNDLIGKECEHELTEIPGKDATCTESGWKAYEVCEKCDYSTKELIEPYGHRVSSNIEEGAVTYTCKYCDITFTPTQAYALDGTNFDGMTANENNSNSYAVTSGSDNPVIVDGHYEYMKNTPYEAPAQAQLWIPYEAVGFRTFTAQDNATGIMSFKINTNLDGYFEMKLVEGYSDIRWQPDWAIEDSILYIAPHGTLKDFAYYDIKGISGATLKTVIVPTDTYTGWLDVMIVIDLDAEADTMTLHYYINGAYVGSEATELTTMNNSITSLYMSVKTTKENTGIMIDDLVFGYTTEEEWQFI